MELKKLNLSIPSMDRDECKSLMGGDGYIMLDEVVVVAPGNERPDDEYDPFFENDQDENDQDENYYEESDRDDNANSDNGDSQSSNYTIPEQVKNAFESLPTAIQKYLKSHGINIIYDPDFIKSGNIGGYSPTSGNITVSNGNAVLLLHEAIHAIQDGLGHMDGESNSAEEFQAHVLCDLLSFFDYLQNDKPFSTILDLGLEGDNVGKWEGFLFDCFDENGDYFNKEYFLNHVKEYFNIFQEAHPGEESYNDPLENNYQWDWETFFKMLGL